MKKRMILDDKLRKLLVDPLPVGAHLTAIFDSCHSGTMLDLDHYLCNNLYFPWQTPASRRYKTMWQHVRRRDAQCEWPSRGSATCIGLAAWACVGSCISDESRSTDGSPNGVRVITKKHHSDHKDRATPSQSRGASRYATTVPYVD